jgi:hypothetical protein
MENRDNSELWMATDRMETGGPKWRSLYIGVLLYAVLLIVILALFTNAFS